MFDFTRQRAAPQTAGPDLIGSPMPEMTPVPLMAPPNFPSSGQSGGLSAGSVSALGGLGNALMAPKLPASHAPSAKGIAQSLPAPQIARPKRPPFESLGPPLTV